MFICQHCGVNQPPKTKPHIVVVETRKVSYNNGWDEDGAPKVSHGSEIVREAKLCGPCNKEVEDALIEAVLLAQLQGALKEREETSID